jgi:2-polyprenyl-3-methyl-5-hydroxy-6-metoxy-1,4-benzoquinol methylase
VIPAENKTEETFDLETRARQSLGSSSPAVYTMVQRALSRYNLAAGTLVDVGCGGGRLRSFVRQHCARYVGVDAIRYADLPPDVEFHEVDLDSGRIDLPKNSADIVTAVEVIEHLENPRAFVRELVRIAKPSAIVLVTTPNQLSILSLLTLLIKRRFSSFQDSHYPAHLTALLEIDLIRIFREADLRNVDVAYSGSGRIVLTGWHYPRFFSRMFPRASSDNILVSGTTAE